MGTPKVSIFFLCITALLAWTGCYAKPTGNQPVILEKPTITKAATLAEATATRTWTPSPTLTTRPFTPSPIAATITSTSLPTLSNEDRQSYLIEKISGHSDCELPCWIGITPGITSWNEARAFLNFLGIKQASEEALEDGLTIHDSIGFSFELPALHHFLRVYEMNGLVVGINLIIEGYSAPNDLQAIWNRYSPKNIMRSYGSPSKVWISTESGEFGDRHPYDLIIAYDFHGITIHYSGWLSRNQSNFRICPRFEQGMDIQFFEIFLEDPKNPTVLGESIRLHDPDLLTRKSKRIREATGLDEEQFAELFIKREGSGCFETPVELWPEYFKP